MNTLKFKINTQTNVLREASREIYSDTANHQYRDCTSKSLIDFTKTHLNYNLCSHPQYSREQIWEYAVVNTSVTPRIDSSFGSTIITLPKDYTGSQEDFFRTAYEGLKTLYNLREEDIISAFVHLDETTPHMHFQFVPIAREGSYASLRWDKVMSHEMYITQHRKLQSYMEEHLQCPVNLINGKTLNINIQELNRQQREEGIRLQSEIEALRSTKDNLSSDVSELTEANARLRRGVDLANAAKLSAEEELRKTKEKQTIITSYIDETVKQFKRFAYASLTDTQKETYTTNIQVLSDSIIALANATTSEEFEYGKFLFEQSKSELDAIDLDDR